MRANILLIADFASMDAAGKLTIVGAFNKIYARHFPAKHPAMYLTIRLVADLGEYEIERVLKIILFDEDGKELWTPPEFRFKVLQPEAGEIGDFTPIIHIQNMEFTKPGRYEFRILLDKELKGTIPFDVIKLDISGAS